MPSITDLTATDSMASNRKPFLPDLREHTASIVTFCNDSLKDNLLQLAKDAYPSAYTFDSDGSAQYTNNLYDKLTASDTDVAGNHTLSTTGAWTTVDLTNTSIAITPELVGDFRATFQFSVQSVSSNATNETDIRFRITDGTTSSDALPRIKLITGVSGTTNTIPVHLSYVFDAWTAAAKTVYLQYFLTTTTASAITLLAISNDPVCMKIEKV